MVATETCHDTGGRGKEKETGPRQERGQLGGNAGKGGEREPVFYQPRPGRHGRKAGGEDALS